MFLSAKMQCSQNVAISGGNGQKWGKQNFWTFYEKNSPWFQVSLVTGNLSTVFIHATALCTVSHLYVANDHMYLQFDKAEKSNWDFKTSNGNILNNKKME